MKFIPGNNTLASTAKYLFVGAIIFSVGLVVHFPYERIQSTLTKFVTEKTGFDIQMDKLSPALPIGFVAYQARIKGAIRTGYGRLPLDLEFQKLRVTVSPFSLLLFPFRKSLATSFETTHKRGTWSGHAMLSKTGAAFDVDTQAFVIDDSFSLKKINPFLADDLTLQGKAKLSLDISGNPEELQRGDLTTSTGKITIEFMPLKIIYPILKEIRFAKISVQAELEKGLLDIKTIDLIGPDIHGRASGSLKIDTSLPLSQLDLDVKLTITKKAESLRSLLQTFGGDHWTKNGRRWHDRV